MRYVGFVIALPLIVAAAAVLVAFQLAAALLESAASVLERRPFNHSVWFLLCTCKKPAGDWKHHHRTCLLPRVLRRLGRECPEDPQTGWVAV